MQEFIGLAYYTDIPAVFFDVQRCGPSTGMPTRTQQADLLLWRTPRTATRKHIVLFPANPRECFEMAVRRSTSPSGSRRRCSSRRTSISG